MRGPPIVVALLALGLAASQARELPDSLLAMRGTGQQALIQEMQEELPLVRGCPNNCSGVGPCESGTCICPPHFGGDDCSREMNTCPNFCSGRGQCTSEGDASATCKCEEGFTGADCSEVVPVCPKGCSDRGLCIEGVCYCDSEWAGPACLERLVDTHVHADDTVQAGPDHPVASATLWLPLAETPAMFVFKTWPELQGKLATILGKPVTDIGLVRALPQADTDANGTRTGGVAATVAVMCTAEDKRAVVAQLHDAFGSALQPVDAVEAPARGAAAVTRAHEEALGAVANVQLGLSTSFPGTLAGGLLRGIKARQVELVSTQTEEDEETSVCEYNCNLHGQCDTEHAICICEDGWYGSYCFTQNECDAGCTEPMVCASDGTTCECPAGYEGVECETQLCDPEDCSGHGTCTDGACVCQTGWTGDKCDIEYLCTGTPLCHTPNGTCSLVGNQYICTCNESFHGSDCHAYIPCIRNCSGNGLCDRGTCICDQGWEGQDCARQLTCAHNCSGHGNCSLGSCSCEPGWTFYDCSRKVSACPSACSYQGNCVNGTCECYQHYLGPECSIYSPVYEDCPYNCTGRGVCVQGQCDCNVGWSGDSCDEEDIPCPNACSGLGTCGAGGVCTCVPGRTGADCSKVVAGHAMDLCAHNCSGKGTCTLGACLCMTGYSGTDCSVRVMLCDFGCSGNGLCSGGSCACDDGYSGSACESPAMDMYRCPNNCSGHGQCVGEVCRCREGFMGTDCRREMRCPRNCSGHGLCVSGQCVCRPGWGGNDKCVEGSATDCSQSVAVCVNSCSGNGECNPETGECACAAGYTGIDCSSSVGCPSNCSGHGLCDKGVCKCQLGFSGVGCSKALMGCDPPCGNGTVCNASVCVSTAGYGGPGFIVKLPEGGCPTDSPLYECSGNGACDSSGSCNCIPGFFGDDCSFRCPNNCSNTDCEDHGVCSVTGACLCVNNYSGSDCSVKIDGTNEVVDEAEPEVAAGTNASRAAASNAVSMASTVVEQLPVLVQTHDESVAAATPALKDAAPQLSIPHIEHPLQLAPRILAESKPKTPEPLLQHPSQAKMAAIKENIRIPNPRFLPPKCASNCSAHGECVKIGPIHTVGKCACDVGTGFAGPDCDEPVLPCPNHCSGAGWCNFTTGKCECDHLFFGKDCSQGRLSPRPCPRNCSGNGICHADGHCACNRRTSGHDCSISCAGGCSGNGVCVNGDCVCSMHYHGDDCADYQPPLEPSPGSHQLAKARQAAAVVGGADSSFDKAFEQAMVEAAHSHGGKPISVPPALVNMLEIDEGAL